MVDASTVLLLPARLECPPRRRSRSPRLRRDTVRRERLHRRLSQTTHIPLALLAAPAGYGKSTLLSHWLEDDDRPVAWLSLEPADDQPARLAESLVAALGQDLPLDLTFDELLTAIEEREQAFVLVLDDHHHLRSREANGMVLALADALRPGSQVVLSGRAEPDLPVGSLRAQGRLFDLRARDLAMTRREATVMLGLAGVELGAEDVEELLRRTEGWPAGLYLAAVSLRAARDPRAEIERFGGRDRLVSDYLRDELLAELDDAELDFLAQTSVLDELTGPLCDAVLQCSGSGAVLRELSRSNLLVMPLDNADEAFRYHPLLADMLQAELRRCDPAGEAELRRRASAWYEASGDHERAIDHAVAAGDVARAGALLWSTTAATGLDGHADAVRRRLDQFRAEEIAAEPTLALTAAAHHLARGERDLVEHWTAAAERGAGDPALLAAARTMRAAVARDGLARMQRDSASAYRGLPEASPWRSVCCLLSGVATHLQGDAAGARPDLEEGARRGAIAAPSIQALCFAQLALLEIDAGDWEHGAALAARARSQVERVGLGACPPSALVFAVSALARAHRDRAEDALADRRRATDLLAQLVDHVAWYEAEARVALARAALRLGDVSGTRTLLAEASRTLDHDADAVVLRRWIAETWGQVEAFTVTELVGPSSLTAAELRILSLMPTHLSFREMGRRLHVSANTIKTHAHAVYRKLDVCSRSEAVVRARTLGLLDA